MDGGSLIELRCVSSGHFSRFGVYGAIMFADLPKPCLCLCLCALFACQAAASAPGPKTPAVLESIPATPGSVAGSSAPELLRVSRMSAATQAERDYFLYLPAGHATDKARSWPVLL